MRILHLDGGQRWGGGQNQVRLLMHALERKHVKQLCLCPAGSPLERRLRVEGLPVETTPWTSPADLRAVRRIWSLSKDFDLLHCHEESSLQASAVAAWLRRRPTVATRRIHTGGTPGRWSRPERVIAVTDSIRRRLIESEIEDDRVVVIPPAIDIEEVHDLDWASPTLRDRLGIDETEFLVGTVGAMLDFKNQKLIPHAAALERSILWVIVGEGPERGNIESAIKAHGVEANVRIAGSPVDARPFIREFNAFVFTSRGEALGASLLDAMALDVPVVAPDDAGPGELLGPVHAETDASLHAPDDAAALAAAVRRIRDEPELAGKMIKAQRHRLADYRIQNTVDRVMDVYREVLGG